MWLAKGAKRYSRRNWEKGIPLERSLASLKRHVADYQEGKTDEDHLAAIACNIMFIIHTEEMIARGVLPEELNFHPNYGWEGELNVVEESKEPKEAFEELEDLLAEIQEKKE